MRLEVEGGQSRFVLRTGPIRDLRRNGQVDPVTPALEIDDRLCGVGATFEEALAALAGAAKAIFGSEVPGAIAPDGPSTQANPPNQAPCSTED